MFTFDHKYSTARLLTTDQQLYRSRGGSSTMEPAPLEVEGVIEVLSEWCYSKYSMIKQ